MDLAQGTSRMAIKIPDFLSLYFFPLGLAEAACVLYILYKVSYCARQ